MGIVGSASGSGSGSGSGSSQGDTRSPGAAADVLTAVAAANGVVQPPRVTLTIELGTLTPESIAAICSFINAALSNGPATAIGAASGDAADKSSEGS